jgi:CHAD domain-containing protein
MGADKGALRMAHQRSVEAICARAARALRLRARTFDRLARQVGPRPTPEGVHRLRVLVRRMRACLWLARRVGPPDKLRDLRRALRKLGRALGARRMLDVAAADALAYGLDPSALEHRRQSAGEKVTRLRAMLRSAAAGLARPAADRLAEGLASRARRLHDALVRAPRGPHEMHVLRIEAKKVRYILEVLGRDSDFIKPLQERLGRHHDMDVLQDLLGHHEKADREGRVAGRAGRRLMRQVVARAMKQLEKP